MGSNPNALKLYDTTEITTLYFDQILAQENLSEILFLKDDKSFKNIVLNVISLRNKFINLLEFKEKVDEDREIETEALIDIAVKRKAIPEHLRDLQKQAFAENYYEAKKNLITAVFGTYPIKTFSPIKEIEDARREAANKSGKSKIDWGLEEYRKFAPDELEKDPQLYQRLVDETYKNQNTPGFN